MAKQGTPFIKPPELVLEFDIPSFIADIVASERGEGPISEAILLNLEESTRLIAKLVTDETPVNFGHLRGAIGQSVHVWYGDHAYYGEVSDGGIRYAMPVEYGAKPFYPPKRPPQQMADSLQLWIVRKQLQWHRTTKTKTVPMSPEQMAWALAWHIAKTGSEGAHMFKKGLEKAEPHIRKNWDKLLDELLIIWGQWGK